jgi:hypothetical protein
LGRQHPALELLRELLLALLRELLRELLLALFGPRAGF